MNLAPYRKAILAFAIPFVLAIGEALQDGGDLTSKEFFTALGLALVTGAGVWAVPNKPAPVR